MKFLNRKNFTIFIKQLFGSHVVVTDHFWERYKENKFICDETYKFFNSLFLSNNEFISLTKEKVIFYSKRLQSCVVLQRQDKVYLITTYRRSRDYNESIIIDEYGDTCLVINI